MMPKENKLNIIRKILFLLGSNKKKLPFLFFLFAMSSVIDLLGIGLVAPFIAILTNPERWLGKYIWLKKMLESFTQNEIVIGLGLSLVGVFFIKCIAYFFVQKQMLKFVYDCRTDLVSRLLDVYQRMPYHLHLSRNSAHLIVNINTHTSTFADSIILQVLRGCVEAFVLVSLFILLAWMNIQAIIIIIVYFVTIIFIWNKLFKKRLFEYGRIRSTAEAAIITGVNHAIGALKEIRLLGRESYFHSEVVKNANELAVAGTKSRILQGIQRYIFEVSLVMFIVGTVFMAMATKGGDPASAFVFLGVFGVASIRILPSITQIGFSFTIVRNNLYAVDELYDDSCKIYEYHEIQASSSSFNKTSKKNKPFEVLECRNLSYKYPGTENFVLKDINIKIRRGESIGVIGKTGCGKTTLIDLLLGLLQPTTGGIYIDGVEISDKENNKLMQLWQSNLIYIPQNIFLVDDTIRRNIAFAVPEAEIDEERLAASLKESELLELIDRLPQGLNTIVGERGIRLSGGERQRICIARAFYFGREVIVMDEATSALDHETETEILKVIDSLHGKRTLIVIAHRLSTTKNCDRLLRLHQGRIITEGKYEDVVDNGTQADLP
jgi:ATP-binding cassette, subfamily B, bacterial PglK